MIEYLKANADKLEISLTDDMLRKFQIFYDMLIETNKTMNLTAITEMHEVVLKHFIDSIALSGFVNLSEMKVIDVGTGAGFPGIPLAILFPNTKFVLMDSLQKRLKFINSVLQASGIQNVSTIHGRAEDLGHDMQYREQFDICVSRAVATLPVLLELCTPFVKVNGMFVSYKSELLNEELEKSKHALSVLHCNLKEQYDYTIPDSDFYRVYAAFIKKQSLSDKYPRQAGKPKRNPL